MDETTFFSTLANEKNGDVLKKAIDDLVINYSPCYAGKSNCMIIDTEGKIYKCTANLYEKTSVVGQLEPSGNIKYDMSNYLLWITKPTDRAYAEKCYECEIYPICLGVGCPYKTSIGNQRDINCIEKINDIKTAVMLYAKNKEMCTEMEA